MSQYTKKLIEVEIRAEEHSQTPAPLLKAPRKTRTESGDSLDSLSSSVLSKDQGDASKTSCVLPNKLEDGLSSDTLVSTNRSEIQEELESVKSEESKADTQVHKVSERSDDSAFAVVQSRSSSASRNIDVYHEAELLEKEQFDLAVIQNEEARAKETGKDDASAISARSSSKLSKGLLEGASSFSDHISVCRETSYLTDGEGSSSKKVTLKDGTSLTEYYKDDFDTSALSHGKDSRSQGEKLPGSRSASIGSDDEISECLSNKASSVSGSIHSGRLLDLKSPTELLQNTERSDVERVPPQLDSSLWASGSKTEVEENGLLDFSIGDRVLISNVQPGTLRFKGLTSFAKGFWAGVELDEPEGNNNGTYGGIKYFDCKEKHGIFAPPQKISLIPESFDDSVATKDDALCEHEHYKAEQKGKRSPEDENEGDAASEKSPQDQRGKSAVEAAGESIKDTSLISCVAAVTALVGEELVQGVPVAESLENHHHVLELEEGSKASAVAVEGTVDTNVPEKWKQQPISWQEYTEKSASLSLGVLEKSETPLLDLLAKERSQLEAQLKIPVQEEKELKDQEEQVSLLTDSLLQAVVKDTVSQLQQVKKARNEKIQLRNRELCAVQENIVIRSELDDGEEVSSPDMCPRPVSTIPESSYKQCAYLLDCYFLPAPCVGFLLRDVL